MGCCYSLFCKDVNTPQVEANERTHLLIDPVTNHSNIQSINRDDFVTQCSQTIPKKTDEQSALNRILQQTATNVIDVAALDSHNLQKNEFVERTKMYASKIGQVCTNRKQIMLNRIYGNCLLDDMPLPEKLLFNEPIAYEDCLLITATLDKLIEAIADIQVQHNEDMVVLLQID